LLGIFDIIPDLQKFPFLDNLVSADIICESGAKVFVSAVGVPPRWAVDKLHAKGIYVMNMVGAPKHVDKALEAGVDLICAQGGEGGGHTGNSQID